MKISWLPDSYQAAITITDDPDNGDFCAFKTMYDFMMDIEFPVTRAMWVYKNIEPTGTPHLEISFKAPLLTEPECLHYCKKLSEHGFEICLHGASCGNNDRLHTTSALTFLKNEIGESPVYICHSKNAENLYWDAKTANSHLEMRLLQLYTKNRCFGDIADSNYFWGDICRENIKYIRMYRTRSFNTLAFNPSMPYHDFSKPFVNYWFSATKGHIPHLFTGDNIDQLCQEEGVSILYQYLHKYVNENLVIHPEVKKSLQRVASDNRILKLPVSAILERLKQIQNLVYIFHKGTVYLINTSRNAINSVKVSLDSFDGFSSESAHKKDKVRNEVIFNKINPLSFITFRSSYVKYTSNVNVHFYNDYAKLMTQKATIYVNISDDKLYLMPSVTIQKQGVFVKYQTPEAERLEILKEINSEELLKLKLGQMAILFREHLFLGRKLSTKGYLKDPGKIEDLSNW